MHKRRHRESNAAKPLQLICREISTQGQAAWPQLPPKFKLLTGLPTLRLWGLKMLKGGGKPAPNTVGEHRFEPHFGAHGLLFSPCSNQTTVLSVPTVGTLPRTTGWVDRFLPAHRAPSHTSQAHVRSDTESGGCPASRVLLCAHRQHFPALVLTSSSVREKLLRNQSLFLSLPTATWGKR